MGTGENNIIIFGDTKIEVSSINNYRIVNDSSNFQDYLRKLCNCIHDLKIFDGELYKNSDVFRVPIEKNAKRIEQYVSEFNKAIRSDEYWLSKDNCLFYLHITTYQEDSYKFYYHNCSFDIFEKMNELNDYLGI